MKSEWRWTKLAMSHRNREHARGEDAPLEAGGEGSYGRTFIIARANKPLVKVVAIDEEPKAMKRFGFLDGQGKVPEDFDTMGQAEIEEMFYGKQV